MEAKTRTEMLSKMRDFCRSQDLCSECKVESNNPNHQCGRGYGYTEGDGEVPDEELLKNYNIVFGETEPCVEKVTVIKYKNGELRKGDRFTFKYSGDFYTATIVSINDSFFMGNNVESSLDTAIAIDDYVPFLYRLVEEVVYKQGGNK